jgi:hypothetical protein
MSLNYGNTTADYANFPESIKSVNHNWLPWMVMGTGMPNFKKKGAWETFTARLKDWDASEITKIEDFTGLPFAEVGAYFVGFHANVDSVTKAAWPAKLKRMKS